MSISLQEAAEVYRKRGWATIPLENDPQGFPKKPFLPNWQMTNPANRPFTDDEWQRATGIGIVLGKNSGGLAVIDIDDAGLAEAAQALTTNTRTVRTVRNRLHVYYVEEARSTPTNFTVTYEGRQVLIELKTTGQQVAAPPTPGYTIISATGVMPAPTASISDAWVALSSQLALEGPSRANGERQGSQRQAVWAGAVPRESRNNTMYIEAHRLREAGVPLEQALQLLRVRWETSYESGEQTWGELESTIQSAYKKMVPGRRDGRDAYRLWIGQHTADADGARERMSD